MRCAKLTHNLFSFILLAPLAWAAGQTAKTAARGSRVRPAAVYVETSIRSWTDGYANWISWRPDVVMALEKDSGGKMQLHTPYLIYFSPDGKPLYTGSSAPVNIDFMRKYPQSGKQTPSGDNLQPTLSEYLGMFPKLEPYKARILARKSPVLLAICKDDTPTCSDQNQALDQFKVRAVSRGVQVVEIKLVKNAPGA